MPRSGSPISWTWGRRRQPCCSSGVAGATYELASFAATAADVAAAARSRVEVVTPEDLVRTDGAGLDPRVREWLLAMFGYYERHGLPVGTLRCAPCSAAPRAALRLCPPLARRTMGGSLIR